MTSVDIQPLLDAAAQPSPFQSTFSPFDAATPLPDFTAATPRPFGFGDILGPVPSGDRPFAPSLPQHVSAFTRKYNTIGPALQQLPPAIQSSLIDYDRTRLVRGQAPLNLTQTANVVTSALHGEPVTPEPEEKGSIPGLIGNAVSDLGAIVTSLPQLPANLIGEARALPGLPGDINAAMQEGGGIGEQLQRLSQLPGIRMIPGAYTAGNVAAGDMNEMLLHPLFTGLDVLPYAGKLAPAAREAFAGTRAGTAASELADNFKASRIGQLGQQMFGAESRDLARAVEHSVVPLLDVVDPGARVQPGIQAFAQDTLEWAREWKTIPDARQAELVDLATTNSFRDLPALGVTDAEYGFLSQYRDRAAQITDYMPDNQIIGGEVYSPQQAARLARFDRENATTHTVTRLRAVADSGKHLQTVDPTVTQSVMGQLWVEDVKPLLQDPAISKAAKREALKGYVSAWSERGFTWEGNGGPAKLDQVRAALRANIPAAVDFFDNHQFTYSGARPDPATFAGKLANDFITRNKKYTVEYRDKRLAKTDAKKSRVLPARFEPMVEQVRQDLLEKRVRNTPDAPGSPGEIAVDPDVALTRVADRQYRLLIQDGFVTARELEQMTREAKVTVAEMRGKGFDPIFIHKVAPERASLIDSPRVVLHETTPSSYKSRTYDVSPYVKDFTVALPHQAMEMLQADANRTLLAKIFDTDPDTRMFARTRAELDGDYEATARARAQLNPRLDVQTWTSRAIDREWKRVQASDLPPHLRELTKGLFGDDVHVPRPVWRNMERLMSPPPAINAVLDLPMRAFRMSVLGLSPRFLLNQALGAMIELTARTDPFVFRYYSRARDALATGADVLPDTVRATMGSTARAVNTLDPIADFSVKSGTTMGRLWNKIQESKALKAVGGVAHKSFDMASWVDDTSRAMAYLYGYDKNLAKGMTVKEAEAAGEAFARKSIQTLDDLTPLERSIMRSVFPFYGFMRHIVAYSYRYAADHPFRVATLSTLARIEQEDWNSGLPRMFQGSFFLGEPDEKGNVKMLTLNGANPWRDMANMFTLAGFTSQVNPLVGGALKSMGVDTRSGGADLYPQLDYDPQTGQLVAHHPGFLGNVMQSLIPQSTVIAGLIGASGPFRSLYATNPEAAQRMFASNLGFPLLFRELNIPQAQFKTELAREQAQSDTLARAVKTGDYQHAETYPALAPIIEQIRALDQQGLLRRYQTAQNNTPQALELAQQSLSAALAGG